MSNRRTRTPTSSAEPSTARRSARLRRRRAMQQQDAGVETPGNYSLYKTSFVVASESTLHPSTAPSSPAIAEDNSRRARYRKNSVALPDIPESSPIASEGHTVGSGRPTGNGAIGEGQSSNGSFMSTPSLGTWASGGLKSMRKVVRCFTGLFSPPSPSSNRSDMEELVDGEDEIEVDTKRTNDVSPTKLFTEDGPNKTKTVSILLFTTICALTFYALFFPAVREEAMLSARGSSLIQGGIRGLLNHIKQIPTSVEFSSLSIYGSRLLNAIRGGGVPSAGVTMEQLEAFERRVIEEAKQAAADEAASVSKNLVVPGSSSKVGSGDIEAAGRSIIEMYEADKGAHPDYALLSAGARVVDSNPSHVKQYARFLVRYASCLVKRSLFTPTAPNPPTIAFTPGTTPGECWAFPGNKGSVTVRLARPIIPKAITMEHTPASSAFSIRSAPRTFRVVGLGLTNRQGTNLGQWEYRHGEEYRHMQSWSVKNAESPIRAVRLEILSNHGADFTCIYRFRVHGEEITL